MNKVIAIFAAIGIALLTIGGPTHAQTVQKRVALSVVSYEVAGVVDHFVKIDLNPVNSINCLGEINAVTAADVAAAEALGAPSANIKTLSSCYLVTVATPPVTINTIDNVCVFSRADGQTSADAAAAAC